MNVGDGGDPQAVHAARQLGQRNLHPVQLRGTHRGAYPAADQTGGGEPGEDRGASGEQQPAPRIVVRPDRTGGRGSLALFAGSATGGVAVVPDSSVAALGPTSAGSSVVPAGPTSTGSGAATAARRRSTRRVTSIGTSSTTSSTSR